ncbi:uncharacterized protein LOC129301855 [Prosopis cineraria]|uniref:uncharacterized protein LOC129301855 n=1 Tax=Prosopis cineraria TaxID=364024 RepID=UPI00240F8CC0|nr:uncharacterized protein LOC129301855 [Prosopis cineraria]
MVGPKRHFLPLVLISLTAFFFYSYYHSSLPPSTSEFNPNLTVSNPIHAQSYNPSLTNFSFIVKVLGFNRLDSLSRCILSLANADYLGDRVHLHVYIDHFAHQNGSSTTLDQKLSESHRILEFVDGFDWKFGEKLVHYRTTNVGLQAQWLEAWWPSSDNEFVFIVEDDLEVSPLYYEFIKSLIVNFYYNASNYSPSIYGASLQRPRFVPGKHGNKLQLGDETRLFLYQLVGTWGQILFPKPWKEFRLWYDKNKAKDIRPLLEGMVTTGWYKKMGERIWTPWFIKFIQSRGYFNIYTNFLHERALSVSHRDPGVNYGKTAGPDSQLLDDRSLDFNILEMHPLSSLKWFDFCFREVIPGRVVTNMDELGLLLPYLKNQDSVFLVNLCEISDSLTRNLLCHFERLNIRNYILFGPESDFLFDLARRGHPVINIDQFVKTVGLYKLTSQGSQFEAVKSILAKAYIIKKFMENGYNSWVVDGNMLFLSADLFLDLESKDPNDDFFLATSLELFYARSSNTAKKMWDNNFVSKVVAMVEDLARKISLSHGKPSFVHVMANLLEENGAKCKKLDETTYGVKIGSGNVNKSYLGNKKLVYWSTEMGLESIQKWLEELNLWVVDQESSCTAVVCHKS